MEIRIIDHQIKIYEDGSQAEMVSLPLKDYDVIELFYLREIYKTLKIGVVFASTRLEIEDALIQIDDVLGDRLQSPSLGLVGGCLDAVV